MVVEILSGPLVKAAYCDTSLESEWGSTFIAIDPNLLVDLPEFKTNCSDLIRKIKSSRAKKGANEIRIPGERAAARRKQALSTGYVDVDEIILRQLGYV